MKLLIQVKFKGKIIQPVVRKLFMLQTTPNKIVGICKNITLFKVKILFFNKKKQNIKYKKNIITPLTFNWNIKNTNKEIIRKSI